MQPWFEARSASPMHLGSLPGALCAQKPQAPADGNPGDSDDDHSDEPGRGSEGLGVGSSLRVSPNLPWKRVVHYKVPHRQPIVAWVRGKFEACLSHIARTRLSDEMVMALGMTKHANRGCMLRLLILDAQLFIHYIYIYYYYTYLLKAG